jgi:hypothetical protein
MDRRQDLTTSILSQDDLQEKLLEMKRLIDQQKEL